MTVSATVNRGKAGSKMFIGDNRVQPAGWHLPGILTDLIFLQLQEIYVLVGHDVNISQLCGYDRWKQSCVWVSVNSFWQYDAHSPLELYFFTDFLQFKDLLSGSKGIPMLWHQYERWCSHFQVITLGKQNVLRYNIINGYIPSLFNYLHFYLCLSPSHRVCMRDAKKSCEERGNKEMWFKSNETFTISFKWAAFRDGVFICPGAQLKVFWKGCFCISSFMALSSLIGAEMRALGRIATRWTRMTSERNTLDVPDVDPSTWAVR